MSEDRRQQIKSFVERACGVLDQVDYYRLLSISSAASSEEIRVAYYKLAASLHPDVHGVDVDADYRSKLTAVFSRVVEAYKVLSESEMRARYDRELAKGNLRLSMGADVARKGPEIETAAALKFYKLASSAMRSRDYKSAKMNLRFALQIEPDNEIIKRELAKAEEAGG